MCDHDIMSRSHGTCVTFNWRALAANGSIHDEKGLRVQAMYAYRDRALSVVLKAGGSSQVLYGWELTFLELIQTFWRSIDDGRDKQN